jgi:hypothetical protein
VTGQKRLPRDYDALCFDVDVVVDGDGDGDVLLERQSLVSVASPRLSSSSTNQYWSDS